jgi:hypothetical protein
LTKDAVIAGIAVTLVKFEQWSATRISVRPDFYKDCADAVFKALVE